MRFQSRFTLLTGLILGILAIFGPASVDAQTSFSPQKVRELPVGRQMHGSAVIGKRLYVFGGNTTVAWLDDVISAEINADGNLGPWRPETSMPQRRAYIGQAVDVVNNTVYVTAGIAAAQPISTDDMLKPISTVLYTSVKPDGSLNPWQESVPFASTGRGNVATCSNENFLFVTGGRSGQTTFNNIIRAKIGEDGTPSDWKECGQLPVGLWFHGAAIMDKKMMIWGGLTGAKSDSTTPQVWTADVDKDGMISNWQANTPMPQPIYSSVFCGFNDYLISVGGRYTGGIPTNDIWYARLSNGRVQPWTHLTTDLDSKLYTSLGLDKTRGTVYIVGGRHRRQAGKGETGHLVAEIGAFHLGTKAATSAVTGSSASHASIDQALAAAAKSKKQVLAYFFSPAVPACTRFASDVLESAAIKALLGKYEFAKVDASVDSQQGYKYSVFRVPALIRLSPSGELVNKSRSLQGVEETVDFLK